MKLKIEHKSKPIVGIIGGHAHNTNIQALTIAEKAGEKLAQLGMAVACGGEDGIMELWKEYARKRKSMEALQSPLQKATRKNLQINL